MDIVAMLLLILILVPATILYVGISISAPKYKGPVSNHFNGKQFINPSGRAAQGLGAVLKWMTSRKRVEWRENTTAEYGKRPLDFFRDGIRVTFVNHSTFLVQVDGVNILTDPVWSKRVSPFTWAGPKRMRPPGIRMEDLPRIHIILLSHNHYDHLDISTMRTLFGAHHPQVITPLGVAQFLAEEGIPAHDLDWWQKLSTNNMIVESVPAQHFSGRGMLDRDATLWCGYVIRSSFGNIYFAGDTGYFDKTFQEIGARIQPIDLALIPIGAYRPTWFMSAVHVSPEEAVKIHLDVRSKKSIASHFGTFPLADEGAEEPITDLRAALSRYNLSEDAFVALKEGEALVIETPKRV